jgi:hypothetical protein
MKNLLLLIVAGMLFYSMGCQLQTDMPAPDQIQAIAAEATAEEPAQYFLYRLDDNEVSKNALDLSDRNLHVSLTGEPSSDGTEVTITIHAFTSEQNHIAWAEANGYKDLAKSIEFKKVMSDYVRAYGIEEKYLSTGDVPQSYYDYEQEQYERLFGTRQIENGRVQQLAMLHKDVRGGSSWPMHMTAPFMWPGWNDEVSRYYQFNMYGLFIVCEHIFYGGRGFIIHGWGFQNVRFEGPLWFLNDIMSSGFSIAGI